MNIHDAAEILSIQSITDPPKQCHADVAQLMLDMPDGRMAAADVMHALVKAWLMGYGRRMEAQTDER